MLPFMAQRTQGADSVAERNDSGSLCRPPRRRYVAKAFALGVRFDSAAVAEITTLFDCTTKDVWEDLRLVRKEVARSR
jgi:hypothetical protein